MVVFSANVRLARSRAMQYMHAHGSGQYTKRDPSVLSIKGRDMRSVSTPRQWKAHMGTEQPTQTPRGNSGPRRNVRRGRGGVWGCGYSHVVYCSGHAEVGGVVAKPLPKRLRFGRVDA